MNLDEMPFREDFQDMDKCSEVTLIRLVRAIHQIAEMNQCTDIFTGFGRDRTPFLPTCRPYIQAATG